MALHNITWPHELVYRSGGQHAVYDDLSIAMFVNRYLAVMETEKESIKSLDAHHPQELMADMELCVWEPIRTYHAVWLQQVENG